MNDYFDGIEISYDIYGEGYPVVLLHGWGANRYTYNDLVSHLKESHKVINIDIPGFGLSSNLKTPLSIFKLVDIIYKLLNKNNIKNPIILGHSFGGRIAIKYASLYDVNKLILVSTPGIRKKKLSIKFKIILYKILKFLKIKNNLGSIDYKSGNSVLKQMLIYAVNTNLESDLKKIRCPTLIMHGVNDKTVDYSVANKMNKLIKSSGIVKLRTDHFPYLENKLEFKIILDSFIDGDIID